MTHTKDEALKLLDALKVKYSDVIYATSPSLAAQFENGIAGIEQALNTATPLAAQISPKQLLALAQTASLELDKVIEVFRMAAQPAPVPLTQQQVVDGFCKTPHQTQYVAVFDAGVRFAENHHGITKGQPLIDLRQDAWNKINSPEQVAALDKTIVDFASGTKGQP